MKIDTDVLDVLKQCTVDEDENILFLPSIQLERKLYMSVNRCLESIGGQWNRGKKGHIFSNNPSDDLDEIINTGEWTDKKKEYQFFSTPKNIVSRMIEFADIQIGDVLCEPSAGDGAILDEFPKGNEYTAIELMPENCEILIKKGYNNIKQADFLELSFTKLIDKIIMNPPFTKGQDVRHILHAWNWLKPGGRLVSIVSESPFFRENKTSIEFRQWMQENNVENYDLDAGAFKQSGTMVKTKIIVANKP